MRENFEQFRRTFAERTERDTAERLALDRRVRELADLNAEHTGLVGAFPKVRVELHGSEVGSFVGYEHEHEVHDAYGKLTGGTGNLIGRALRLEELGAKAKKALPDRYRDAAGAGNAGI